MSENAKEEDLPRDDLPFDYNAKANKFYMDVETDGSLEAQEVVHKVSLSDQFWSVQSTLLPRIFILTSLGCLD